MTARGGVIFLAAIAVLLTAGLVAFVLLYLSVPQGYSPFFGWAPGIAAKVGNAWPDGRLSLSVRLFTSASLSLLVVTWALYTLAVAVVARLAGGERRDRALLIVAVGSLIMHLALVATPPLLSKDLYHYALFGRMVAFYGLNPYVTGGQALAADPMWAFASWRFLSTHYGPPFTWLSAGAAALGGDSVVGTALAFKAMAACSSLAVAALIYRLAKTLENDGLVPLALYAWNPLVLIETASSGHNEAVMMAFALAGLLLARNGRANAGFALLVVSATVKYVTGVLGFLFFVHTVWSERCWRARARMAIRLTVIALVVLAALYAPFWQGAPGLSATVDLVMKGRALDPANATASGVGWPTIATFAALVVLAAVLACRGPSSRLFDLSAMLSLGFVLFVFHWKFPWYFIPAITLTIAGARTKQRRALLLVALWLGLFFMLPYAVLLEVGG